VRPSVRPEWGREDSNLRLITYSVTCGVADYVSYSGRSGVYLRSLKRETIPLPTSSRPTSTKARLA
jgi:hypothetical protein